MKILVINGPNLNMLGIREPDLYGTGTYAALCEKIEVYCATKGVAVSFYQSNHEGALVDRIQEAYYEGVDGIVINPGAYTHTSIALLDAVKAVGIPTVEVHLSRVEEREEFRRFSYVSLYAAKTVTGKGFEGYREALAYLAEA